MDVLIVGAGIGGLTLALTLHEAGVDCRLYEASPQAGPVGVGINVLPHAARELARLGLEDDLAAVAVLTRESVFFNRFGQMIYREPSGRSAGYRWPQYSIHRADLHAVLLRAVQERLGPDRIQFGWRCVGADQDEASAEARFVSTVEGTPQPSQRAAAIVGCDGIRSVIRATFYPDEREPRYSGVNMWRGTARLPPFLSGASMVRAGWLTTGKMVIYPIRDNIDGAGTQLVNWVAEIETPNHQLRDWNRRGLLSDFEPAFADWHFDWLDVPAMLGAADEILEYPMTDQDPLPRWSFGRITLLGDAAHPMVPRGSNGAGQAILDARVLANKLAGLSDPEQALQAYEAERLPATSQVVLANRVRPPDIILQEVYRRTGDRPFSKIEDVISIDELRALSERYKVITGYSAQSPGMGEASQH
jgi:2-polyprenyl-6-methoxyphenol hydroxylase-like FAD-dependent oxidoreductase